MTGYSPIIRSSCSALMDEILSIGRYNRLTSHFHSIFSPEPPCRAVSPSWSCAPLWQTYGPRHPTRHILFQLTLERFDIFIIFHHFFLVCPVSHALNHGEWHALTNPLCFGYSHQKNVPQLNTLSCQSSVANRALIVLWCWSECYRPLFLLNGKK